jgi:hypothetical protein
MDQLHPQTTSSRSQSRRAARSADRANAGDAAAALQRALDRRDNGGVTGHMG